MHRGRGPPAPLPRSLNPRRAALVDCPPSLVHPAMELGLFSFVETRPEDGRQPAPQAARRLEHLLEEARLADAVGLDAFGVGEHHRPDYVASAPAVLLAAMAAQTERIRLTSAVSVLGSDDPLRVFQDFATLDLLSGGRAEIIVGRGSFTESFPLFGHDLRAYELLFEEKLDLLLAARDAERPVWQGRHRPPLDGSSWALPRPLQPRIPIWRAVGGTPESFVRAGRAGLPLAVAIIGGTPDPFVPLVDLYRQAGAEAGHDPAALRVSVNGHGFLADTAEAAAEIAWPPTQETMGRIGRERGWAPPTRARFDAERSPRGALLVGSAQEAIDKILRMHELFGLARYSVQLTVGPTPHADVLRAIELFGTEVAPVVRRETGAAAAGPAEGGR